MNLQLKNQLDQLLDQPWLLALDLAFERLLP